MSPIKSPEAYRRPKTNTNASRKSARQTEARAMMKAEARKRVFVKSRDLYNERDRSIAEVHRLLKQISDDPNHSFSDTVPPRSILYD